MAANNLRQADVPDGASVIEEMPGTAPGLVCPVGDQVIYAVPGVPFEMRIMVSGTVVPDLKRRAGVTAVITSRVLRTWVLVTTKLSYQSLLNNFSNSDNAVSASDNGCPVSCSASS